MNGSTWWRGAVAKTDTLGLFDVHDGQDILPAFDDVGDLTTRYLHGTAVDQILADEHIDDRDIVDSDSDVLNQLVYGAFGEACRHFYTTHAELLRACRVRRPEKCRHCGRKMVTHE